jgi:hypothetical protein
MTPHPAPSRRHRPRHEGLAQRSNAPRSRPASTPNAVSLTLPRSLQVDSFTWGPVASAHLAVQKISRWSSCRSSRSNKALVRALVGAGLALAPGLAHAAEPYHPSEPRVLSDTAINLLEVADSLDGPDAFDLNIRLTFEHSQRWAPIHRETTINQPGLATGGFIADNLNVANYSSETQRLIPEVSVGLLPDLALTVKLPIILAHSQKLTSSDPSTSNIGTRGADGEQLFSVPFTSPTRSGVENLTVGLDLSLMNQWRNPANPTWTIGVEGRFNVSDPMRACNAAPRSGQVECANPADRNRNGRADDFGAEYDDLAGTPEGDFSGGRSAGVSRGTTALEAHAYVSKRRGYIEPYSGVSAVFEFPTPASDYGLVDLEGSIINHPPLRGTLVFGLAVIPWEQPERHRRIAIDFRARGTYVSEGRDYSELFDALGSSSAASLRNPNFAEYTANIPNGSTTPDPFTPSVVDTKSDRVWFTGLTDVQQYGDYDLSARFTWQAGEYVNFDVGAEWRITQGHIVTFDQACNPSFAGDPTIAGPCKYVAGYEGNTPVWEGSGKANPNYRRTIGEPGHRFKVDTAQGLRAWVSARVMF